MQRADKRLIELQQRLAARADDHWTRRIQRVTGPRRGDCRSELRRRCKSSSSRSVRTDKISVAEATGGAGAVRFPAGPEVAPREAQKHRRPTRLRALALQRVVQLLDAVAHRAACSVRW